MAVVDSAARFGLVGVALMRRLRPIEAERFQRTRIASGFTRAQAAHELGVSERTVRNWERGRRAIPYAAFRLLRLLGGHKLPGEAWRGFWLQGDTLYTPEGKLLFAWEMRWLSLTFAMARFWLAAHGHPSDGLPGKSLRERLNPDKQIQRLMLRMARVSGRPRGMGPGDPKPHPRAVDQPSVSRSRGL